MESLIIQLGIKHGKLAEIHRTVGEEVTIGRGYHNDIILTDPYIAPEQVRFYRYNHQWMMQILDHTNRVLVNGDVAEQGDVAVKSGDTITIGRTQLKLFADNHQVENTRKLLMSRWLHNDSIGYVIPLIAVLLALSVDCVDTFMASTHIFDWKAYAYVLVTGLAFLMVWAGGWAITGRLVRNQYHFGQHLVVIASVSVVASLISPLANYLEFVFSSTLVSEVITDLLGFSLFAGTLKYHLLFATNIKRTFQTGCAISISAFLVLFSLEQLMQEHFVEDQRFSRVLQPSFIHIGEGIGVDDYFYGFKMEMDKLDSDVAELREKLKDE